MKEGWWKMMKDDEGWWRMNEEWWRMMISSCWGVLVTDERTDGQTFVIVESLSRLKIVQMNRLQLESFNEILDWKLFWYELTCQEKHTIGHLGRQIPYKPWCLLQIVDNLCEPDPAWRILINGIWNGIALAGFDHIGLSHPKKTNSFCATNNSVENTVKWYFYFYPWKHL